jgi:hypothetical protein
MAAMAAANPASTEELAAGIGSTQIEAALTRAMTFGQRPAQPVAAGDRFALETTTRRGRTRDAPASQETGRRSRAPLGLGLAAATAIAALLIFGWPGGTGRDGHPEFASAAVEVAEANPRLLVGTPGWKIVRADEFRVDEGELTFSDGSHQFEIHWYPADLYERYLRDRANVSTPEQGTLLGQRATTVDYGREEYATMLSPQGKVFIEVRGQLGSQSAYDEILQSLQPVDVDAWLGAMPASTVRPEARSATVDEMLRGIPLPPGFDAAALRSEDSISDRDSLAVKVGNAVACAWAESWIAARGAGEEGGAQRAVAAIEGSNEWPIVRETKAPWFSNYAVVAREMRAGHLNWSPDGYETETNGRTFGFGPAWKLTLGCKGTYRREVDRVPEG